MRDRDGYRDQRDEESADAGAAQQRDGQDVELPDLLHAIRVVARGESLLSPGATRRLIARVLNQPDRRRRPAAAMSGLEVRTDREREVLTLVGGGLSNDEIAAALFVSPLTSKTHVSRIMTKLAVRDRARLVVHAHETGLVSPGG